jgi:uncharacterized protein (TIGR00369 family)
VRPTPVTQFVCEPDPENPGWLTWDLGDDTRFNGYAMGKMIVRREGESSCRLRMFPEHRHSNMLEAIHGAVTLALIDIALFAAVHNVLEGDAAGAVTLELHNQFIGSGRIGEPYDAVTEVLRETKRLVFLRGLTMQGDHLVASFTGTVRKASKAP